MFLSISAYQWAIAERVKELRQADNVNRGKHATERACKDTMGAIAEIVWAFNVGDTVELLEGLYRPRQARDSAIDGVKRLDGHRMDVKCIVREPRNRNVLINANSHRRALGKCDHYNFVMCRLHSMRCYVIQGVPYQDVSGWPVQVFSARNDPAHYMLVADFLQRYSVQGWVLSQHVDEAPRWDPKWIKRYSEQARAFVEHWSGK